jgi:hypothetical protein
MLARQTQRLCLVLRPADHRAMNTQLSARQLHRWTLTIGCLLGIGVSCSNPSTPNASQPDCVAHVTLSVTPGTPPRFDWQPRCAIVALFVYEATHPVWAAEAETEEAMFGPPVRFGIAPSGVHVTVPPQVLQSGHSYTLVVGWFDPQLPLGTVPVTDSLGFIQ